MKHKVANLDENLKHKTIEISELKNRYEGKQIDKLKNRIDEL